MTRARTGGAPPAHADTIPIGPMQPGLQPRRLPVPATPLNPGTPPRPYGNMEGRGKH